MTDLNVLYNSLLERAREVLPKIPDHPTDEFQAEAAILIAETSGQQVDWEVARRLTDELTELDAKVEKLEDIAKITQNPADRMAAMRVADEAGWNLDDDFSPKNISFVRSALRPLFSSKLITQEEIERERDDNRADILQVYVFQLVNLGELNQALEVVQSILSDEAINISKDKSLRKRYWCRSMQAVAVGYARAGDFCQANTLVEKTPFMEYGYIRALMEIAGLIQTVAKEGHPSG